jgi:hypothetical protein
MSGAPHAANNACVQIMQRGGPTTKAARRYRTAVRRGDWQAAHGALVAFEREIRETLRLVVRELARCDASRERAA